MAERFLNPILTYAYLGLLILILLPFGSVEPKPLHLIAIAIFLVTALALLVRPIPRPVLPAAIVAFGVIGVLDLWALAQTGALGTWFPVHPVWQEVAKHFGDTAGAVSVAPGDSLQSMVAMTLPFAIFMAGLVLFAGDTAAFRLIRVIAVSGALVALFGLIQFLAFPDTLMFETKLHYRDSLTATFVNRNSTATYLGMVLVLLAGLVFAHVQNAGLMSFLRRLIGGRSATRSSDLWMALFYLACLAVTLTALMLTKSRAGIASSMAGLLLVVVILAFYGGTRSQSFSERGFSRRSTPLALRLGRGLAALAAVAALGLFLSGRALLRAEASGGEDARFCALPAMLRLAGDSFPAGTGLGTFRMVFPAYRDPACGISGTWERAHNFYLEALINLGLPFIPAAIIVIIGLVGLLIAGIRARRQARWLPVSVLGVVVIQLIHNAIDFSLQIPAVAAIFAAILAGGVTISRGETLTRRRSSSRRKSGTPEAADAPAGVTIA